MLVAFFLLIFQLMPATITFYSFVVNYGRNTDNLSVLCVCVSNVYVLQRKEEKNTHTHKQIHLKMDDMV